MAGAPYEGKRVEVESITDTYKITGTVFIPLAGKGGYASRLSDRSTNKSEVQFLALTDVKAEALPNPRETWEAPFIAARLESFREIGTIPVVSSPRVTELCLDKWATFEYVRQMGWSAPVSFISLEAAKEALETGLMQFPVILKPRRGQGSVGIEVARDRYELEAHHRLLLAKVARMESNGIMAEAEPLIIQQYLSGEGYDLEVVNDLDGRYVSVLAKKKLSSRAGECELAQTVEEQRLTDLGSDIGSRMGHLGVLDVDVIAQDGILYVLEFNPRFGGCYPFSHMAGANLPAAYVAWAIGREPDPSWLRVKPGVKSFKGFALVVDRRG